MSDQNMSRMENLSTRAGTVKELYRYITQKRLWGMVMLVTVLLLISVVVITAEAVHFLAPFVYVLF